MKIFTKKSILQKTILVIITVLCVNFIVPTYSSASIGGVLINPILDLIASVGDILETVMQYFMTGEAASGENIMNTAIMKDNAGVTPSGSKPSITVSTNDLDLGWGTDSNNYQVPDIKYSPEEIFTNKVPYLEINFINPQHADGTAAALQPYISKWYVGLRTLSIVGLLCVLVYVGIKIILSSTGASKAKYKQMFTDWLVALCLLFFLHYIMSFTLVMVDSINDALTGSGETSSSMVISVDGTKNYTTNLMGAARFMVQSKDTFQRFSYLLIYLALIVYTAIFTWHYLKRVLMMAFLTIIAPLVSLTYPIDKMGDGKAQAFNMWLKEYVYTALMQPFHLIIYTVFVGSAIDLARTNLIYAIAAIAFILPAEKILKKMFGFDRAPLGTMGALTGFTAGSIASKFMSKGGGSKAPTGGNSAGGNESKAPRYERRHGTNGIDFAANRQLEMKNEDASRNAQQEQPRQELGQAGGELTPEQQKEYQKLGEDLDNADYNDMYMNPNKYQEEQEKYAQMQQLQEQQQAAQNMQQQSQPEKNGMMPKTGKSKFRRGVGNIINANGGGKGMAIKGAKTLGRAAKFTTRTFMAGAGMALGAGAGIASGQGIAAIAAGAAAGRKAGGSLGRSISNMPEKLAGGAYKVGRGIEASGNKFIDTYNGNTNLQDAFAREQFKDNDANQQYIRDKLTEENGRPPKQEEITAELDNMNPYLYEGMTDVSAIYRAEKAEKFGVSAEQSAKIAVLAQERKIDSKVLGDKKQYEAKMEDFTQEFINKGQSQAQAAQNADYVLNVMKAQVGQQHNLQRLQPANNVNTQQPKAAKKAQRKRPEPINPPIPTPTQTSTSTQQPINRGRTGGRRNGGKSNR